MQDPTKDFRKKYKNNLKIIGGGVKICISACYVDYCIKSLTERFTFIPSFTAIKPKSTAEIPLKMESLLYYLYTIVCPKMSSTGDLRFACWLCLSPYN